MLKISQGAVYIDWPKEEFFRIFHSRSPPHGSGIRVTHVLILAALWYCRLFGTKCNQKYKVRRSRHRLRKQSEKVLWHLRALWYLVSAALWSKLVLECSTEIPWSRPPTILLMVSLHVERNKATGNLMAQLWYKIPDLGMKDNWRLSLCIENHDYKLIPLLEVVS